MLLYVAPPKEPSLVLIPHKTLQGRDDLNRFWRFLSASDPLWECWQRGLAVPVKMSPFSSLWENDFCKRRARIHKVMCFLFYSLCPQIKSHREAQGCVLWSRSHYSFACDQPSLKGDFITYWVPKITLLICSPFACRDHLGPYAALFGFKFPFCYWRTRILTCLKQPLSPPCSH